MSRYGEARFTALGIHPAVADIVMDYHHFPVGPAAQYATTAAGIGVDMGQGCGIPPLIGHDISQSICQPRMFADKIFQLAHRAPATTTGWAHPMAIGRGIG